MLPLEPKGLGLNHDDLKNTEVKTQLVDAPHSQKDSALGETTINTDRVADAQAKELDAIDSTIESYALSEVRDLEQLNREGKRCPVRFMFSGLMQKVFEEGFAGQSFIIDDTNAVRVDWGDTKNYTYSRMVERGFKESLEDQPNEFRPDERYLSLINYAGGELVDRVNQYLSQLPQFIGQEEPFNKIFEDKYRQARGKELGTLLDQLSKELSTSVDVSSDTVISSFLSDIDIAYRTYVENNPSVPESRSIQQLNDVLAPVLRKYNLNTDGTYAPLTVRLGGLLVQDSRYLNENGILQRSFNENDINKPTIVADLPMRIKAAYQVIDGLNLARINSNVLTDFTGSREIMSNRLQGKPIEEWSFEAQDHYYVSKINRLSDRALSEQLYDMAIVLDPDKVIEKDAHGLPGEYSITAPWDATLGIVLVNPILPKQYYIDKFRRMFRQKPATARPILEGRNQSDMHILWPADTKSSA